MTEEQLRDVLARVVPEPPDSVTDATPVVRAARRQRRARVAGAGLLAAALVGGTVAGVGLLGGPDDDRDLVADPPALSDPFTTAPCPDPAAEWPVGAVADLDQVTAVRYCARDTGLGFQVPDGPRDALVDDAVGIFTAAVGPLPPTDPSRCAAIDVLPTDSRLLLQLADGTSVGVPASMCLDVDVEGRALDGNDVATLFLSALREQRAEHPYTPEGDLGAPTCSAGATVSPARPGSDTLVAGTLCPAKGGEGPALDGAGLEALELGWRNPQDYTVDGGECTPRSAAGWVLARTDRGDVVRFEYACGGLFFVGDATETVFLEVDLALLKG